MAKRSEITTALMVAAGAGALIALTRSSRKQERPFDFQGRTVFITGGSRGLGLVIARQLAAQGARIALCARSPEDLEAARHELEVRGAQVFTRACDLRNFDEVKSTVADIESHLGSIDVLINNAGTIAVGPLETMTLDDFHEQMDSIYWSAVHTVLAVLPGMQARRSGRIVNISSIGGKIAVPHLLPYCASKFALTGFSRGLRTELRQKGITVTTVCPGLMRTGSPRNADFKGQHRAEYTWFSIADSTPGISMDAEEAARQTIEACRKGDVEAVLSLPAKLGATLDAVLPEISGELLSVAARLLPGPGGVATERRKGYESESILTGTPLTGLGDAAARRNNELRHSEAGKAEYTIP